MTFCVRLDAGAGAGALIGGKARSLLRLAAAGLPVPPAFVVTADVYRALRAGGPPLPAALDSPDALASVERAAAALATAPLPAAFAAALDGALGALGGDAGRFSVRSSATIEDRPGALAAGVFLSRTDVARDQVAAAVRAVMAAALSPAAVAYAASRGLAADDLAMAVLIHPFTAGGVAGTAAHDPTTNAAPIVEPSAGDPGALTAAVRDRIADAVRALAAREGAVEVEWVSAAGDLLFLQLRPYQARTPALWSSAALIGDGAWRWDAAHNPLPLSPAQAGLVALVDARCRTPFRQRVAGGYLFYAADATRAAATAPPAGQALRTLADEVAARLAVTPASLEQALEAFVATYEPLFGVVQPAARAAREALAVFLRAHHPGDPDTLARLLAGVPSRAAERTRCAAAIARAPDPAAREAAVAAYLAAFGDEAPVWDVAVPTFAEDPAALRSLPSGPAPEPPRADIDIAAAAAEQVRAALPPPRHAEWRQQLQAAREASAVAEDDDALYAKVQTAVRRALLREGERLRGAGVLAQAEDVFWLGLDAVRRDAAGQTPLTRAVAARAVRDARQAYADALADPPPLGAPPTGAATAGVVRGRSGSPGRVIGRARMHPAAAPAPARDGQVVIARTLLPTELPMIAAAAIVVETGGVLGHVAAQARERGIPAVVDAAGACAAFRDGDRVLVDGDAGVAIKLPG